MFKNKKGLVTINWKTYASYNIGMVILATVISIVQTKKIVNEIKRR